jgi:hypothetical protein
MFEWLSEATSAALLLVIVSVLALAGGSFSAGGITFDLKTAKGKSYFFIILVGIVGLVIITFDFFYYLDNGAPLSVELERLTGLHASGALTDEEFASAKQKLLSGNR